MEGIEEGRITGRHGGGYRSVLLSAPRRVTSKGSDVPARELRCVRIFFSLVRVRVTGFDRWVVPAPVDLCVARFGVVLRQQSLHWLRWRKIRIAVIEVAVSEREAHRLIDQMQILR